MKKSVSALVCVKRILNYRFFECYIYAKCNKKIVFEMKTKCLRSQEKEYVLLSYIRIDTNKFYKIKCIKSIIKYLKNAEIGFA